MINLRWKVPDELSSCSEEVISIVLTPPWPRIAIRPTTNPWYRLGCEDASQPSYEIQYGGEACRIRKFIRDSKRRQKSA